LNSGFYIIMAAQFFSSLADNALLVAAIALLMQEDAPSWLTPYLKFFFVVSYVALAPYVGAFADRLPKGHVMFIANTIKICGCVMMLWGANPLLAYAVVGLGAAAYSPAKYGILTEYLPHRKLVIANGWIEGLTVASILLGTVLGGVLIHARVSGVLLHLDFPGIDTPIDTPAEAAIAVIVIVYAIAAVFNLHVPRTGVALKPLAPHPLETLRDFAHCVGHLWKDRLGQISLAVTTLFWGAGATLQFIVIDWARSALGFDLSKAAILQGVTAFGIAIGAVLASLWVALDRSVRVIPLGIAMGLVVIVMIFVHQVWLAIVLMVLIGALASAHGASGRWPFAVGACLASTLWFLALGFGARLLAPLLASPRAWQVLDLLIAATMLAIAFKLSRAAPAPLARRNLGRQSRAHVRQGF